MIKNIFILCLIVGVVTGCGRKSIPVSSVTETNTRYDSLLSLLKQIQDSSVYHERIIEKTIPASTVNATLTPEQLQTILQTLKNSPGQTISYTDTKLRAQVQLLLDSVGNLQIKCTSLEKTYFEKYVKEAHYRETLVNELTKVNNEKKKLETQVRELKQSPWQIFKAVFNNMLVKILLGIIGIGLIVAFANRIKNKLKAINPFTK